MACVKQPDGHRREAPSWSATTGLPSDVAVEAGGVSFHLHKFPLLSRSAVLRRMLTEEQSNGGEESDLVISVSDLVPGGATTFELVARFCYGARVELTASNVIHLRCAAEVLGMTEEYGDGNLVAQTERFLDQVVLNSWKDSLEALRACSSDRSSLSPMAERLGIVGRCIDSLASTVRRRSAGNLLWNGISTGAKAAGAADWWYEDVSSLDLSSYKKLLETLMDGCSRAAANRMVSGSVQVYAKMRLPGLNHRRGGQESPPPATAPLEEQKLVVEEVDAMLPVERGLVPTKFLFGLLRTGIIVGCRPPCLSNLERRIGMQLDRGAHLEDLLLPTFSYTMETLYDVDRVQRILDHYLDNRRPIAGAVAGEGGETEEISITGVAKLLDGFLAEVAPDVNLKPAKFQALASALPDFARPLDDGLYRAVDVYLKTHPWLDESDREQICRLMDLEKLSAEARIHAAQNERLPLRVVVQILFFEQLHLRSSSFDAACGVHVSEVGPWIVGRESGWRRSTNSSRQEEEDDDDLQVGVKEMKMRVAGLERDCSAIKKEIGNRSKGCFGGRRWSDFPKILAFRIVRPQMCTPRQGADRRRHSHLAAGEYK